MRPSFLHVDIHVSLYTGLCKISHGDYHVSTPTRRILASRPIPHCNSSILVFTYPSLHQYPLCAPVVTLLHKDYFLRIHIPTLLRCCSGLQRTKAFMSPDVTSLAAHGDVMIWGRWGAGLQVIRTRWKRKRTETTGSRRSCLLHESYTWRRFRQPRE